MTDSEQKKKIPIAFILDNFWRGGGTENQLATLIDHIDRDQWVPYVFNLRPMVEPIEINCEVIYLNVNRIFSIKAIKEMLEMARFLRDKKINLLQVYFLDSRIIGVMAGWFAGVEHVIACRRESGWWQTPWKTFLMRTFGRLAKYRLVNAKAIKRVVQDSENFPIEDIEVVYNGVDFKARPGAREYSKSDFNIPDTAPVIGMVGNLREVKRYDRLLIAVSKMKNKEVHVFLIGTGPQKESLEKMADELGIFNRVHIHHATDGTYNILKLIDIGILTSESEGLSNVLIEYALAGMPTIAYDVGGNAEVVIDNETGFVLKNGDVDGLADKIDILLDNPELALKFGTWAVDHARKNFSVENMVKATENLYKRILNMP